MNEALRGLGLILVAVTLTWGLSSFLGRVLSRKSVALWVWDRSGSIGRVLLAVGAGMVAFGFFQGASEVGPPILVLGSLFMMGGLWLIVPI